MQRKVWAAVKYIALTLLGIALYRWGADVVYAERGYFAIGGEVFTIVHHVSTAVLLGHIHLGERLEG